MKAHSFSVKTKPHGYNSVIPKLIMLNRISLTIKRVRQAMYSELVGMTKLSKKGFTVNDSKVFHCQIKAFEFRVLEERFGFNFSPTFNL